MSAAKRFFRRYILSTAGILVAFFVVNLLLFAALFFLETLGGVKTANFPISTFSAHVTAQNGRWQADQQALTLLRQENAWAMLLDDAGTVRWSVDLPETLPRQYTAADVATFSRWYLQDYPTTVWVRDDGLMVVGFPKGSQFKFNFSTKIDYISLMLAGIAAAFLVNVLLMLVLFLRNTRRVERAMGPLLEGIEALSQGKPCHLEEHGELAELNAGVNKAVTYLRQKDNTRAEWIRGISHDIRTPLSMILGYASELEEQADLPEQTRLQAGIIRRQGEKLKDLVADLNLTTKLAYALQPLQKTAIDPAELGRQVVSETLNGGLSDRYPITLQENTPPGSILIGDPQLLGRMLHNLIRNSVVHNPSGCHIMVAVEAGPDEWLFTVSDTGQGLSPASLAAFCRGEDLSSTQSDGEHGLGLKLVRQIAAAHGGWVDAADNTPSGLRVIAHLPRRPAGPGKSAHTVS